jgi:outer membrane protein assembly factor BamA
MMAGPRIWLAGTFVLLAATAARADVGDYLGRPVTSVRLEIEGVPSADEALRRLVEPRVGTPLSLTAVRRSIVHLTSLASFENVVVHAAAEGEGVGLRYALTPAHPIEQVVFGGVTRGGGVDQGALRREIVDRFGEAVPVVRAQEMADAVAAALRVRGYQHARVGVRTEMRHAPHRTVLFLTLEPGERTRVVAVDVVGTADVLARDLRDQLGVDVGDPYEPEMIGQRLASWVADRRRAGHFESRVTLTARFDEGDAVVALTLTVSDGPPVRVVFAGDPLPAAVRDRLAPVATEGSVDEDLLEDSTNRIEEYLRAQGYRDASAPYAREESAGALVVTFTIRRGALYRVARLEITGNASVPFEELAPGLRVREGQPFVQASLDADRSAVEARYERLGFTSVIVEGEADPVVEAPQAGGQVPVVARLRVTENARAIVESVRVEGNDGVGADALLAGLGLQPGRPLQLSQLALDRDAIEIRYANLGYRHATVASSPGLSADGTRADVLFSVREGPQLIVDHVLIVGNSRTRADTIEREIQLRPGEPLGAAAIIDSQQRLAALGLFRRVRITDLSHGDETRRDVLVSLEEAPATTIGYGGGVEVGPRTRTAPDDGGAVERLEFRPRAFFEIGRRNLFGKNRSISLFTRVSLGSDDELAAADGAPARGGSRFGLGEYRVLGTFREPRVFQTLADAFLTGTAEQQIRPSFKFTRRAFSAEVARAVTRTTGISGNYQIQRTVLFDERFSDDDARLIDRLFPKVRLSSFSVSAVRDTRDDQLNPTSGHYTSMNAQLAARRIGSQVGFLRSFMTAQLFRQMPGRSRIVVATSARLGLASGFPREETVIDPDGQTRVEVVEDLPLSERFFAGGDTTVRGFALDQLGTAATIDQATGFPLGGNALAIFNMELRMPVVGGLGLVGFVDVGNVFRRTKNLDLGEMRGALGVGVRYASPVGPLRVDLGFKTDRREIAAGRRENLTALHISLGQAF